MLDNGYWPLSLVDRLDFEKIVLVSIINRQFAGSIIGLNELIFSTNQDGNKPIIMKVLSYN